jgi:large conductance mechanosensitive channel
MSIAPKHVAHEFFQFVREQGVITLAIGFLIGGAVSKLVTALIVDIINPIVGLALGAAGNLKEATFAIGSATIAWGDFVSAIIDFLVIALVVYFGIKLLGIEKKQ